MFLAEKQKPAAAANGNGQGLKNGPNVHVNRGFYRSPHERYQCLICKHFVGETNLAAYDCDKLSKRGSTGYCETCMVKGLLP